LEAIMTHIPLDPQTIDAALWPVPTTATPIALDALLSGLAPNLDIIGGLLAFTVLAMIAIAWFTALPVQRRRSADGRNSALGGASTSGAANI
jgi:hypothetical protein